jgi:hypothetical protein
MAATPAHFDFRHFERLPEAERLSQANAAARAMFPPGTTVEDFERSLTASGARCSISQDHRGPAVICSYHVKALSLVSTDWNIVGRTDGAGVVTGEVQVNRWLTGL